MKAHRWKAILAREWLLFLASCVLALVLLLAAYSVFAFRIGSQISETEAGYQERLAEFLGATSVVPPSDEELIAVAAALITTGYKNKEINSSMNLTGVAGIDLERVVVENGWRSAPAFDKLWSREERSLEILEEARLSTLEDPSTLQKLRTFFEEKNESIAGLSLEGRAAGADAVLWRRELRDLNWELGHLREDFVALVPYAAIGLYVLLLLGQSIFWSLRVLNR